MRMTLLTNELLTELLSARPAPCLSVYQSTHGRHPENKQDPIRFRNLVKELDREHGWTSDGDPGRPDAGANGAGRDLPALSGRERRRRRMQVQVNTDSNIDGREKLAAHVESLVESTLSRFSDRITRVEVHLSHQNGDKSGHDDKRCMMEARLEGRQPVAVTHQAATLNQAIHGAADRLQRSLESTLERLRDRG
jgi:ribosome-associated translation inhibitor RaiA